MKNLERLIGLGLLTAALLACGGGSSSGSASPTANTGGGGSPSPDEETPSADDPMAPAPAPTRASFAGREYSCEGDECQLGKFDGPLSLIHI